MKTRKAFTLIELLVVIAIIGVLATISIIALSNARAKSRDAKRAGDMKQIQTALELFFNDKNRYPTAEEFALDSIFSTSTYGTSTYMQIIPDAPTPIDGTCTSNQNTFFYTQTESGNSYNISFCLGNTTGTLDGGPKCLTPAGIMDVDCSPVVTPPFVCGDSVDYGGQSYNTVLIGTRCWFAENLNFGTKTTNTDEVDANAGVFQKHCYNGLDSNCTIYGGLYQWHTVMALPQTCDSTNCFAQIGSPHQGICPSGWHVPDYNDFISLGTTANPIKEVGSAHWTPPYDTGTNTTGFTALASGFYIRGMSSYAYLGNEFMAWSTYDVLTSQPYIYYIPSASNSIAYNSRNRFDGHAVRCVQD